MSRRARGVKPTAVEFAARYNAGHIPSTRSAREVIPVLYLPTFRRWLRIRARRGPRALALAGHYGNRLGAGALDTDPELAHDVANCASRALSARKIRVELVAKYGQSRVPSGRTILRFVSQYKTTSKPV